MESEIPLYFKRGDLVFFHDINTLPHLRTLGASFLHFAQSWTREGDASVIHVGFIDDENPSPKQGETVMNFVHSMPGDGVKKQPLFRNYHLSVFRLKSEAISPVNAQLLASKAVDYALQFIGVKYSYGHCAETYFSQSMRENAELNEQYTRHLAERHVFNPGDKTILTTRVNEGMHCSEAVITCLQLATLAFSESAAVNEILPDFARVHYHTSPVGLYNFVKKSDYFEEVDPEQVHVLRMSGLPHPEDYTQAIIPYVPPAPPTPPGLRAWLWSQVPTMPNFSFAFSALSALSGWFARIPAQTTEVKEMVSFSGRNSRPRPVPQPHDEGLSSSISSKLE